jgi:phosphoglycolate phosphatase
MTLNRDASNAVSLPNQILLNKQLVLVKPIELILFDLDGTLIDSAPDLEQALNSMLSELTLPTISETLVREWIGNGATKLVERALDFTTDQQRNNSGAIDKLDVTEALRRRAFDMFLVHYDMCCAHQTVLYDGVIETLEQFSRQQITMAIVTNKPRRFIAPILQHLGIGHYFTLCLGGDDLSNKKPHPEPLLHAIEVLGFDTAQVLMVGDSRNDIAAARAANIKVAAMNYGYNHGRPVELDEPDAVFASMIDLAKQLA